ncbi:hypothetical protein FOCC_FOCC007420 [Frankliniella occidentalis]|nr:hypothetical protein FOCC_FOCC007420 [Frankliniella occidentalis]
MELLGRPTTSLAPPAASQLLLRRHSAHCSSSSGQAGQSPQGPPPPVPVRTKPGPPPPICQLLTNRPSASMSMGPPTLLPPLPVPLPPPPGLHRANATTATATAASQRRSSHGTAAPNALSTLTEIRCLTASSPGQQLPAAPDPTALWGSRRNTEDEDSSVSSDSYSQTSSPSYTSKTMETPLLPHHKAKKKSGSGCGAGRSLTRSAGVVGSEDSCTDSALGSASTGDRSATNSTSAITKSNSTPASLQAVVRLSGSSMSLHHKIIRDHIRRPSVLRARTIKVNKFQAIQLAFNAVALYINTEVGNPLPGVCMPVIVTFCLSHRIPYNYTMVPSYVGHMSQTDAQQFYDALVDVHCYELSALFLCTIFAPKCGAGGRQVKPCRSLCREMMRRCEFFLEVFGLHFEQLVRCDNFPEYGSAEYDGEECVGHHEYLEAEQRARAPACADGFLCDKTRCIPKDFRCDGHQDCVDETDEKDCHCPTGTEHCGEKKCISHKHVCNGVVECPHGQDERNCIRLSESMGDVGSGKIEVFHPDKKEWRAACVQNWQKESSAQAVCSIMGYKGANDSRLMLWGSDRPVTAPAMEPDAVPVHKYTRANLYSLLRNCSSHTPTVHLSCYNFECGRRRHPSAPLKATARIIGGSPSRVGDWPFLAALLGGPEKVFYCAGVLISDQWLLTASHCVGNPD